MSRLGDQLLRQLEREAASGSPEAVARLHVERRRRGLAGSPRVRAFRVHIWRGDAVRVPAGEGHAARILYASGAAHPGGGPIPSSLHIDNRGTGSRIAPGELVDLTCLGPDLTLSLPVHCHGSLMARIAVAPSEAELLAWWDVAELAEFVEDATACVLVMRTADVPAHQRLPLRFAPGSLGTTTLPEGWKPVERAPELGEPPPA